MWQLLVLEKASKHLSRAYQAEAALLTPWIQPSEITFGVLTSISVREQIYVILSCQAYSTLSQLP